MGTKLNKNNLNEIEKLGVKIPSFDLTNIKAGIVHFGLGNFHRAHQAVYLNRLFNKGLDLDWGIIGAGNREPDILKKQELKKQDYLFTVIEQSANVSEAEVNGSLVDYFTHEDMEIMIETLCDESIRIVSLTITEGGYFIDSSTGKFDDKDEDIVYDSKNPNDPNTVFGIILKALKIRKEKGIKPFTIMSCDNIPHNGVVTKNTFVGLAKLSDEDFASWIEQNVAFPNGMVDRITPATTQKELDSVLNDFDLDDREVVYCEDFIQWVLEDNFPTGRPALEKVGVEFVSDVTPYEHMKIRILNGGHAIIAYIGGLLDVEYAYEAMDHPLILKFFKKIEENEILPVLPPVPNTNLNEYYLKIQERFSNPKIEDTIRRLCLDGSNRQPKFIIPTIADCIEKDVDFRGLALESALWCRYCYGTTESGTVIEPNDPSWNELNKKAIEAKDRPQAWIEMRHIYGNTADNKKFQEYFTKALNDIYEKGVVKAVEEYINN